jgi:thioredoxin-related protein
MSSRCLAILFVLFLANQALAETDGNSPESPVLKSAWQAQAESTQDKRIEVGGTTFETTVNSGLKAAANNHKLLLVFMKKPDCPHCAAFEKETLPDSSVQKFLSDNFVCAKILRGTPDEQILKHDFGCNAFPHFVVFDHTGKFLMRWFGQPKATEEFLTQARAATAKRI